MIDKENRCVEFSEYIGCRQQCLYGCFCFVIFFLCLYNSDNFINMKNVDWVLSTVMREGCNMLELSDSVGREKVSQAVVLFLGGGKKSISKCIFDLVNTLNLSGGLVGPGNSMWFHNAVFCVCGVVGHHWKKLIKNHAFINDTCGFLIQHVEIGPGYIYSLFTKNMLGIGSGGSVRGFFSLLFSKRCWLRQMTCVCHMWYLMSNNNSLTDCFQEYDTEDINEENIIF